ncbi:MULTISPECIES: integrase core domain-containing protein [Burkholderiaceae]|uniref:integrase core domain-containing protein n=1 Tax=Burkholderiaceae TaxID=119060 RepID=UPI0009753CA9|nr:MULTISPECIES: integrase core domain-containing protein [Burkholderiaceae]
MRCGTRRGPRNNGKRERLLDEALNGSCYGTSVALLSATAARNLAIAFEHYNEKHPHSALKYRSLHEFQRTPILVVERFFADRGAYAEDDRQR